MSETGALLLKVDEPRAEAWTAALAEFLPDVPVIVKAKFFTSLAEKKIKKAGGACLLTA